MTNSTVTSPIAAGPSTSIPLLRWCDSHCHLDDDRMDGGAGETLNRARAAGVERCITIGTDAAHTAAALAIAAAHDDVWATVGLHPHDAINGVESILGFLGAPKVVAIGECGLDFHYNRSPRQDQLRAFADQVALANERNLALVIHTRSAWEDTFDVLDAEGTPERTIFHCFSGGPDEARSCLDRGAYLSFSGIVTFKSAEDIRAAARLCPTDRMLVETDAPYLAPVPFRGKTNEPALVPAVGAGLVMATGRSLDSIADTTFRAAAIAFGL